MTTWRRDQWLWWAIAAGMLTLCLAGAGIQAGVWVAESFGVPVVIGWLGGLGCAVVLSRSVCRFVAKKMLPEVSESPG